MSHRGRIKASLSPETVPDGHSESSRAGGESDTKAECTSSNVVVELTDDVEKMTRRLRAICCKIVDNWGTPQAVETFQAIRVLGGCTNSLFRCWTDDSFSVVVRIFGVGTEDIIDREREREVSTLLAKRGFGKTIYGEFSNGRIEEWINGRPLTHQEMILPDISQCIAKRLGMLHSQRFHTEFLDPNRAEIWPMLNRLCSQAVHIGFPGDIAKQSVFESIDVPKRIGQVSETWRLFRSQMSSPIVLSHNDLLAGNIIIDDSEHARHFIQFIDFEYACYNFRAFDIANHFCEMCGSDCDWELFPSRNCQEMFARAYLSELLKVDNNSVPDNDVEALINEVAPWVLASDLLWGFWALKQASMSNLDLDYMGYAWRRFSGYDRHLYRLRPASSSGRYDHIQL